LSDLKNPIAIRNGVVVTINDLSKEDKGMKCNCFCPYCGDPFLAKMGDINSHHFSHSIKGCDAIQAYLAGLYHLLKEIIDKKLAIYLPPLYIEFDLDEYDPITSENVEFKINIIKRYDGSVNRLEVIKGGYCSFDNSELIKNDKGEIQALLLNKNGKKLAVKITPPDTVCKTGKVTRFKEYSTLEINFKNDFDRIQKSGKSALEHYIKNDKHLSYWIYNQKISEKFDEVISISDKYCKKVNEERELIRLKIQSKIKKKDYSNLYPVNFHAISNEDKEADKKKKAIGVAKTIHEVNGANMREIGYLDVKDKFYQQIEQIFDRYGNRWIKCRVCGETKPVDEFIEYGGANSMNLGRCYSCANP